MPEKSVRNIFREHRLRKPQIGAFVIHRHLPSTFSTQLFH